MHIHQDKHGNPSTNVFILKTCRAKNAIHHDREVTAYNTLAEQHDVMQYLAHCHSSWTHNDTYCMLLEYIEGGTLADFLERADPPTYPEHILRLWESLLGLSKLIWRIHSLHTVKFDEHTHLQG